MQRTHTCALLLAACLIAAWLCAADGRAQPVDSLQLRQLRAQPSAPASLSAAGPTCIKAFYNTTQKYYQADAKCTELINQAFAATSKDFCPAGGSDQGSEVHKCLQKSSATSSAWAKYLTDCPLGNVIQEKNGFSCFPNFNSVSDFKSYMDAATTARTATSGSISSSRSLSLVNGAFSAAAVLLLWVIV